MSDGEIVRRKLEKVDAMPVASSALLAEGRDPSDWGQPDWEQWLGVAYSGLDVPYANSLAVKNSNTKHNMAVVLEQLYEGASVVEDLVGEMFAKKGKQQGKKPTVYVATNKSMEQMRHGTKASISYTKGDIFVNLDNLSKDASQYWEGDNETFHYFAGKNARGEDLVKTYAGFAGKYLLQGVEMASNHYFEQLYGSLEGVRPLDHCTTLAEFDAQPSVMFGLLMQTEAVTLYLDRVYEQSSARRRRRGREIEYPHLNDKTVELFLKRIADGWSNLPRKYQAEFTELRQKVEEKYQESLTRRNGIEVVEE